MTRSALHGRSIRRVATSATAISRPGVPPAERTDGGEQSEGRRDAVVSQVLRTQPPVAVLVAHVAEQGTRVRPLRFWMPRTCRAERTSALR
jgi:hypothetical protein